MTVFKPNGNYVIEMIYKLVSVFTNPVVDMNRSEKKYGHPKHGGETHKE